MMPALRKYTFLPATGQIIARTVTGEEKDEPTTTAASSGQGAQGQETKAEAAQAKAAKTKATGSKKGAEAPQLDKPKGSLKVAGAEDEDAENIEDAEGEEEEDCLEELAALNEMQGVAGGKRKPKAAGKTQPKKKAKAKAK